MGRSTSALTRAPVERDRRAHRERAPEAVRHGLEVGYVARDRGGVLGRDGGQQRQAERAAHLARGVHQPGREPGLRPVDAGRRGDRDRDEGEPDARRAEQRRREHVGRVAAVGVHAGEEQHPGRYQRHPEHEHRPGPEAAGQARRRLRADRDRERHRQERDARLDRRVPEHLLQVERDEVPHREDRAAEAEDDHVRARQRPRREDPQRHERARRDLPSTTRNTASSAAPPASVEQRARRAPAVLLGPHDPVRQDDEAERHGQRPRQVELARRAGVAAARRARPAAPPARRTGRSAR